MGALGLHVASCATSILNVIYNGILMRSGASQNVCVKFGLTSCRYCLNALRAQCVPVKDIQALIALGASQSHPAFATGVRHVEGERSRPSSVKRRSPPNEVQGVARRACKASAPASLADWIALLFSKPVSLERVRASECILCMTCVERRSISKHCYFHRLFLSSLDSCLVNRCASPSSARSLMHQLGSGWSRVIEWDIEGEGFCLLGTSSLQHQQVRPGDTVKQKARKHTRPTQRSPSTALRLRTNSNGAST